MTEPGNGDVIYSYLRAREHDRRDTDDLATSWAIQSATPLGRFARRFRARIASEAAAAVRPGGSRRVPRA